MLIRLVLWALLLVCPSVVQAANTTLGNLAAGSAVSGTDLFYDVQSVGAGGVKVTGTQLGTFLWALGGATTSSSTATFSSSALLVKGSSTGTTAFASANAGASNFTLTFPAATDQLIARATTDTLTNKTYDTAGTGNVFKINGTSITAISGNTGTVGTTTGALTSTHCVNIDASGNLKDSGAICSSGGLTVGTSTVSGGAAGNYLYTDGTLLQASTGITWVGTGQQLNALGTITTNLKALNITATWNAVGTTFDAPLFMNITNTASATGSALVDWQIGGTSAFQLVRNTAVANNTAILLGGAPGGSGVVTLFTTQSVLAVTREDAASTQGAAIGWNATLTAGGVGVDNNGAFYWTAGSVSLNTPETTIYRDASYIVAQRHGTNAQTFRVYNTFTDASNYERGVLDWGTVANTLLVGTQNAGTGSTRNMEFIIGGTNKMDFGVTSASNWSMSGSLNFTSSGAGITNGGNLSVISTGGDVAFQSNSSKYGWGFRSGTVNLQATSDAVLGWGASTASASFPDAALDTGISRGAAATIDIGNGTAQDTSGTIVAAQATLTSLATDATHTDNTVCWDTTSHILLKGSGAAGICLGTSSLRFKHDVVALEAGLDAVMRLQPISYKLNADHGDPNHLLYGFSAENGEIAAPDLVGRDAAGRPNTFDYLGVVPVLVRAVQQLQHEIEELRAR